MKLNIKPKINDISYSNNKDIRKAKKNCKRKLNRPKMRLHFGWYILKGHLNTTPRSIWLCGNCCCRLELRGGSVYGKKIKL